MARMEAGVPGPSLVHVPGHVEVECDPEAGAATTLRECSGLRWAGQRIPPIQRRDTQRGKVVGRVQGSNPYSQVIPG